MWSRQDSRITEIYELLESGLEAKALARLKALEADAQSYSLELNLRLASLCTLFAERGLKSAQHYLSAVKTSRPLFIALSAETRALQSQVRQSQNQAESSLKLLKRVIESNDALTCYHGARALMLLGESRRAQKVLETFSPNKLPVCFQWRYWSLVGELLAQRSQFKKAIQAFDTSLNLAPDPNKPLERFSIAELWLHMSRPDEALRVLGDEVPTLDDLAELVRGFYLFGVAKRQLGQLHEALSFLQRARVLAQDVGELPFELLQELARLHAALGQVDEALATYGSALDSVPAANRSALEHEYARALKDFGHFNDAETALRNVLAEARYSHRAAASAELAEVSYFLGKFSRVKPLAEYAIRGGVVGPACLSLGRVALEYFHLEEAEAWLEQAASASATGEPLWLSAQLLLTETFAHKVDTQPERLKNYAERALSYLPAQDPWIATLESYVARADKILAGQSRIVN